MEITNFWKYIGKEFLQREKEYSRTDEIVFRHISEFQIEQMKAYILYENLDRQDRHLRNLWGKMLTKSKSFAKS
jgi:hypothetical protein